MITFTEIRDRIATWPVQECLNAVEIDDIDDYNDYVLRYKLGVEPCKQAHVWTSVHACMNSVVLRALEDRIWPEEAATA